MPNTKEAQPSFKAKMISFIASPWFFVVTLIFFVIQAGWLAISSLYPMSYDEETHLGIANYFAGHLNPFFSQQPAELNIHGAVIHDPSYLYRYLIAIPYKYISQLVEGFVQQVIIMRFTSIALFVVGLIIFRKLLLRATDNKTLVNLTLLLVTLTPIVPQLGAHINYDNLFIPMLAGCLLLAVIFSERLKANKFDVWILTWLASLMLLTSLVKFTFLTILLPMFIFLTWKIYGFYKSKKQNTLQVVKKEVKQLGKIKLVIAVVVLLASFGLFFERYGMNVVRYRTPTPECVQVIGEEACQSNSIYRRSVVYSQTKPDHININPALFTFRWLKHMLYNLVMALSGPTNGYATGQPLPLPYGAAIVFAGGGLVLSLVFWRKIFNNTTLRLFAFVTAFYLAALWVTNYVEFINTGRRVAVQGRYLVPFLPLFYLCFLLAFIQLIKWPKVRTALATILVACFLAGGGAMTVILHSDNTWYWSDYRIVQMNNNARKVIRKVVPGWGADYKPYWKSSFQF